MDIQEQLERFRKNWRKLRKNHGHNQTTWAEVCFRHPRTYLKAENGKSPLLVEDLFRLSDFLKVAPTAFFHIDAQTGHIHLPPEITAAQQEISDLKRENQALAHYIEHLERQLRAHEGGGGDDSRFSSS